MVRTTLALDAEILNLAKNLAAARGVSLGEAINSLIRRGLTAPAATKSRNGFVTFDIPAAPAFGPADVHAALDRDDEESAVFFPKRG